jgi:NDP-sugar pyrophosphorylase family protein
MTHPTPSAPAERASVGRGPPDAVVLAAGHGVRLRPLTDSLPKVLVPIDGRPLLAFHLEALHAVGIRRVVLVVGYRGEQVRALVGDGTSFGLEVQYVEQRPPRGTGDAVRVARPHLRSDPLLVIYGDVYVPAEGELLRRILTDTQPKIVAAHVANGGTLGRLTAVDQDGREVLAGLLEKDGQPTPGLVNAGVYLLPHRILDVVDRLPLSPRGEIELTDGVLFLATHDVPIEVVRVEHWFDIADHENLAAAEKLARSGRTPSAVPGPTDRAHSDSRQ